MSNVTQDRIRVWNEETHEMLEPRTIPEILCAERNVCITEGWTNKSEDPFDIGYLYGHLVFMRNTGIYDQTLALQGTGRSIEIFENDLITHGSEPYLYRVVQKGGCWRALSLYPDAVPGRLLNSIWSPRVVGNTLANKDMVIVGKVDVD